MVSLRHVVVCHLLVFLMAFSAYAMDQPPKRKQVQHACFNCQNAHAACSEKRPCTRCEKRKMECEPAKINKRSRSQDADMGEPTRKKQRRAGNIFKPFHPAEPCTIVTEVSNEDREENFQKVAPSSPQDANSQETQLQENEEDLGISADPPKSNDAALESTCDDGPYPFVFSPPFANDQGCQAQEFHSREDEDPIVSTDLPGSNGAMLGNTGADFPCPFVLPPSSPNDQGCLKTQKEEEEEGIGNLWSPPTLDATINGALRIRGTSPMLAGFSNLEVFQLIQEDGKEDEELSALIQTRDENPEGGMFDRATKSQQESDGQSASELNDFTSTVLGETQADLQFTWQDFQQDEFGDLNLGDDLDFSGFPSDQGSSYNGAPGKEFLDEQED